ncbi:MAG: hypothetical protein R3E32_06380 [Chitinophagales bacterium]
MARNSVKIGRLLLITFGFRLIRLRDSWCCSGVTNAGGNRLLLNRSDLKAGVYFFEVLENGVVIGKGKLMINN